MVKNLRPRQAAVPLGIGLSSFWLDAKTNPDLPPPINLGPKAVAVREAEIKADVERELTFATSVPSLVCSPIRNLL